MAMAARPKVFVSGCYDLLHSGHVEFFLEASQYGDLYVALGSDKTIVELKGRPPVNPQDERLFMVKQLRCVTDAFISRGSGKLDFIAEFEEMKPQFFIVGDDGIHPDKEKLCQKHGTKYIVLKREPHKGLPVRSSTSLKTVNALPYRIDMAGGWLDQPYVSKFHPGAVITFSIEPSHQFNERSGMATSTRNKALQLWGPRLPSGDPVHLAKVLFAYDNPPGTQNVSGSQDAIGLVVPGICFNLYGKGQYWPERIQSVRDESLYEFLESSLHLLPLEPRHNTYNVLEKTKIDEEGAKRLADAADGCWKAIMDKNLNDFGKFTRLSFEAQIAMFPNMINDEILSLIKQYEHRALGWKLSGAGGGGYLILVSATPIENTLQIRVRRESY